MSVRFFERKRSWRFLDGREITVRERVAQSMIGAEIDHEEVVAFWVTGDLSESEALEYTAWRNALKRSIDRCGPVPTLPRWMNESHSRIAG